MHSILLFVLNHDYLAIPGKLSKLLILLCRYQKGDKPPQPRRNIQSFWQNHCEGEWQRAFFMFSASEYPLNCHHKVCLTGPTA